MTDKDVPNTTEHEADVEPEEGKQEEQQEEGSNDDKHLVPPSPARHLRNRKPGNKNYPWHYDESTRGSEIQWNS